MKNTLSQLVIGEKAVIESFNENILQNTKANLLEMGAFEGQVIKKIRSAILGDPSIYSIQGRKVAFRNQLANDIQIKKIH